MVFNDFQMIEQMLSSLPRDRLGVPMILFGSPRALAASNLGHRGALRMIKLLPMCVSIISIKLAGDCWRVPEAAIERHCEFAGNLIKAF